MSSKIPIATTGKSPSILEPLKETLWSLYIHIPFCTKKCPYCHFFVVKDSSTLRDDFAKTLLQEWQLRKQPLLSSPLQSLYLGGGTPSLLSTNELETILSTILADVTLAPNFELTLEVNPESYTLEKAKAWKKLGVNRLSIGVQSFSDPLLKTLGRTHSSNLAIEVIEELNQIGFENISMDLMLETPHQTAHDVLHTLEVVKKLPLSHLSLYNMTFEEGSQFFRKQQALKKFIPPDEENLLLWKQVASFLSDIGLKRYEISAFSKKGKESIHNQGYWEGRPFLGLGPSAFSLLDGIRTQNIPDLKKWTQQVEAGENPISLIDSILPEERYKEQLLIALRLLKGIHLPSWIKAHGDLPISLSQSLKEAIVLRWIQHEEETLKLTEEGILFYDSLGALCI